MFNLLCQVSSEISEKRKLYTQHYPTNHLGEISQMKLLACLVAERKTRLLIHRHQDPEDLKVNIMNDTSHL